MSDATRILVVDDDPKIRTVVRRGLAYEGYRVVEAASGEEGLEKAREHLPDLVILDVMMPGIDGLEVTRRLRSAGDLRVVQRQRARACRRFRRPGDRDGDGAKRVGWEHRLCRRWAGLIGPAGPREDGDSGHDDGPRWDQQAPTSSGEHAQWRHLLARAARNRWGSGPAAADTSPGARHVRCVGGCHPNLRLT